MTMSSLCVVLSSLSLNLYVKPRISEGGFIVMGDDDGIGQKQPNDELSSSSSSSKLGWLRRSVRKSWFRSNGRRHAYLELPSPSVSFDNETVASGNTTFLHEITPRTRLGHFV